MKIEHRLPFFYFSISKKIKIWTQIFIFQLSEEMNSRNIFRYKCKCKGWKLMELQLAVSCAKQSSYLKFWKHIPVLRWKCGIHGWLEQWVLWFLAKYLFSWRHLATSWDCSLRTVYRVSQKGTNCSLMGFPCRHFPSWLYAMSYALSLSLSSQMYFENTVSCEWFRFLNLQNFPLAMERDSTHTGSTIEDCILSYKSYFILDNSTLHVPIYNWSQSI